MVILVGFFFFRVSCLVESYQGLCFSILESYAYYGGIFIRMCECII